jgi:hypothetical protein
VSHPAVGLLCPAVDQAKQHTWKGTFRLRWLMVKDVPNSYLRHITLANNNHKPLTHSRDTQEVPPHQVRGTL